MIKITKERIGRLTGRFSSKTIVEESNVIKSVRKSHNEVMFSYNYIEDDKKKETIKHTITLSLDEIYAMLELLENR